MPLPGDDGPIDLPGVCVKTDDGECVSDEDCPDGFVCAAALGLCVPEGGDNAPPGVVTGTMSVSDALIAAAETLGIDFEVSEALGRDPLVQVLWPVTGTRLSSPAA